MDKTINITLKVWRQRDPKVKGAFQTYQLEGVSVDSSFLEMLDILNSDVASYIKNKIVDSGRLDTYVEKIKQHETDPYTVVGQVVKEMLK